MRLIRYSDKKDSGNSEIYPQFNKTHDNQESEIYPRFNKTRDIIFLILFSIFVAIICITQIINTVHNLRKNKDIQYPQSP